MTQITITEVGPRDGLQNEPSWVPTELKIKFINELAATGLREIEATSFVSEKNIPQLADNEAVFNGIIKPKNVHLSALVPNIQGLETALPLGIKKIALFTAASETFNQKNINCSIAESLERFKPVMELAKKNKITVRAYISCVLGCPYEGEITPKQVTDVANALLTHDVDEISLGDTIGVGTPKQTKALLQAMQTEHDFSKLALHCHDTYGQALANIYTALELGITSFDSSVAGLGGCPYAHGATGNVATEDVLYLIHGLGLETGVDLNKVITTGDMICKALGRTNQSNVAKALLNKNS